MGMHIYFLITPDADSNRNPYRFFNDRSFHNHTPFHLLVEWVLGGTPAHLTAIWDQHVVNERPQFRSRHAITAETFNDHLGDEHYYQAYLHFFSDVVLRKPVHAVLEEWIFSSRVNYDTLKDGMLNRLLAGVMHPLIYVGFGLEFGYVIVGSVDPEDAQPSSQFARPCS